MLQQVIKWAAWDTSIILIATHRLAPAKRAAWDPVSNHADLMCSILTNKAMKAQFFTSQKQTCDAEAAWMDIGTQP
jgi:hypothetical protein